MNGGNAAIRNLDADILIIGGGPAGLTSGLYGARAGRKTIILEGRAPSLLKHGYLLENYPGFLSIDSVELLSKFKEHARFFGAEIIEGEVINLSLSSQPKFVATSQHFIEAKAVIIASGKPLSTGRMIPGEESFVGMGVSYCATCDGPLYKGKKVAALGHGEEADEDISALLQMGVDVIWFPGGGDTDRSRIEAFRNLGGEVVSDVKVKAITGKGRAERLLVERDGREEEHEVSAVFIFREVPTGPLFAQAGVELDHKQCIKVSRFQETNLHGVFAAGDITCGGMQVVAGAGEGAVAAIHAIKFLRSLEDEQ
jgi:thioredoxin reductase (NADPH)